MRYDPQAEELNAILEKKNPAVLAVLSRRGKRAFFPKNGIIAQAASASHCAINATIGIALEDDGTTVCLESLSSLINLSDDAVFQYAPSAGMPALRETWRKMMRKKNPGLGNKSISLPVVTTALTHGIYLAGKLLLDQDDQIVISDYFWENYELVLCDSTGASFAKYPTFNENGGYNIAGFAATLAQGGSDKKVVILNFPNNPTGYTPTQEEAYQIRDVLVAEATKGSTISVIIDDAYFGLVFAEGIFTESLFSLLADAHHNILAIKTDGATKEDYVWGFRTGFITFGIKDGDSELYNALEMKIAGFIRGSISNAPKVSQSMLLQSYQNPAYETEKLSKFTLLQQRFSQVKNLLESHIEYLEYYTALPFNSGYFMCVRPAPDLDAETIREVLLNEYGVGLIQVNGLLRVAFSSTPTDKLPIVFDSLYHACKKIRDEQKTFSRENS